LGNLSTASSLSTLFKAIIAQTALIPSTRCCTFLKKARDTYASYALAYLNNVNPVTAANLDSLGPCFASNIPASRLTTLSVTDFISRIKYFTGLQTQLDTTSAAAVATLINNALGYYTLENLIFNLLQDAAIYSSSLATISKVII
jgi:hypothetical protein